MPETEAYDRYLHPRSRISATELAQRLARGDGAGHAIPTNRAG